MDICPISPDNKLLECSSRYCLGPTVRKSRDIEQLLVIIALCIVFMAAGFDLFEDWQKGEGLNNVFLDILANLFVGATLIYILIQRPRATRLKNIQLEQAMHSSRADLKKWKAKASTLLEGLGAKIDEQFSDWQLSLAEKEVALFLVKGYSTKEIARLRDTHEKTVRQQASSIYTKATLDSRAELAAFFLEDLLLPQAN